MGAIIATVFLVGFTILGIFLVFDIDFTPLIDAKTAKNNSERYYAIQERKRRKYSWEDILRDISYQSTIGNNASKNYVPLEYADDFKEKLERRGYGVEILTSSSWDSHMCYIVVTW